MSTIPVSIKGSVFKVGVGTSFCALLQARKDEAETGCKRCGLKGHDSLCPEKVYIAALVTEVTKLREQIS